jgi:predicted acylesterase/phospholipase RssA
VGISVVDAKLEGRTALVLCGGGITGAMYELGVLAALDDFFIDFDCSRFDIYVGTSAGAMMAFAMAAEIRPHRLCRAVLDANDDFIDLRRTDIFQLGRRRMFGTFRDLASISLTHLFRVLRGDRPSAAEFATDLRDALPSGIFSLKPYERFLNRMIEQHDLPRTFRDVKSELYITANDLDSGHRAIFGQGSLRDISIAKAICASSAIPVFFEPMRIGNRDYIDGASGKTGHVDIAMARGADLVLVVNPRVPIYNDPEREGLPTAIGGAHRLRDKGMVTVWDQAERMSTKTKLHQGLRRHAAAYPRASFLLIEPKEEDSDMFLQNPMNFASRRRIVRYGYESAVRNLSERRGEFQAALSRHSIGCDPSRLGQGLPSFGLGGAAG